jgi:transcriptional regulator with XRE-family HTH domain
MAKISEEFGKRVTEALTVKGLSLRGVTYKTGISFTIVGNMRHGIVPSRDTVFRFATGLGLDTKEWMILAGYEQPPSEVVEVGAARIEFRTTRDEFSPSEKEELRQAVEDILKKRQQGG